LKAIIYIFVGTVNVLLKFGDNFRLLFVAVSLKTVFYIFTGTVYLK